MIKKIIFSLIIGIVCTLFIFQQDPWLRKEIGQVCCAQVGQMLNCKMSFSDNTFNIFSPSMTFYNVKANSLNTNNWSWKCATYTTGFSWWNFFIYGVIDMWVVIKDLHAQSELVDKQLAIKSHIDTLLQEPELAIPLYLTSLVFDDASLTIFDHARALTSTLAWSSESQKVKKLFKTRIYFTSGNLSVADQPYCEQLNGLAQVDSYVAPDGAHISVRTDNIYFNLPQLSQENKTCFISGAWSDNVGRFMVCNAEQSFVIDPLFVKKNNDDVSLQIDGQLPLAYVQNVSNGNQRSALAGMASFTCKGLMNKLHGSVTVTDAAWHAKQLCTSATATFSHNGDALAGIITMHLPNIDKIDGTWQWSYTNNKGILSLFNTVPISVPYAPYWQLKPDNGHIDIAFDASGKINGTYTFDTHNTLLNTTVASAGSVSIDGADIRASCTLHDYQVDIHADLNSDTKLQKCVCSHKKNKHTIHLCASDKNTLTGHIDYPFIRGALKHIYGYDLQGEGSVHILSTIEHNTITTQINLEDGTIRLPQTYNFIDKFSAQSIFDLRNQILTFNNITCGLHTGTVYSPRIVLWLDDAKHIVFAHAPFMLDRCLLNVKKDLFAIISGCILLKKERNKMPLLSGCLTIDRAQLKENIFSQSLQKTIFGYSNSVAQPSFNMLCDIAIQSKYPIRVDTTFLETSAQVDLTMSDQIAYPQIIGSITLSGGALKFPYRPLIISKGALYFAPNQTYDPVVELIARNKVKKYNVGLHVSGSLYNHHIILDSTPPLSEEQIVSLLLVGSHEESLNMIMPALIMQNVRNLLFGSNQSSILEKFFVRGHRSFNINLIPSFSDQTGRGGLRGALEIDVNDRWRALLQKNFSLSEDTRFELEYLLSDDITIRGIRNERRDISTEVEMRWKF